MGRLRGVLTVGGLCLLVGCAETSPTAAPGTTRSAHYKACPRFNVNSLPKPFAVVEQKLPNLGENFHGRIERWSDGSASVTFYAGHDVFDDLEDLDFTQRTVTTATRAYVVHETPVDPLLVAVSWEERDVPGPCVNIAVLAHRLSVDGLLRVADGTRIGQG